MTKIPCDYGSRGGFPNSKEYTEEEKDKFGVEDDLEVYVNRVMEEQLPPAVTRDILKEATARDKPLRWLMEDLEKGECRKALTRYTQVFSELAVVDGMVMWGEQLVIPKELQPVVVQLAHEGHFMYEKTEHPETVKLVPRDGRDGQGVRGELQGMPSIRPQHRSGTSENDTIARQALAIYPC